MCCIIMLLIAAIGAVLIPILITKLWKYKKEWSHWEISSIAISLLADFFIILLLVSIWSITDSIKGFYCLSAKNSYLK
jgi:hypothetical protein